jgi:hypothetical protein
VHRTIHLALDPPLNVMGLDAATIVGLVLGILGLWGLPTLWTRFLYVGRSIDTLSWSSQDLKQASKVPRRRAEIHARITCRLDTLHDRASGNLRGVGGFEAQIEDIERFVKTCLAAQDLM